MAANVCRLQVSVDVVLDFLWEVSIARFPSVSGGILTFRNTQPIVFAVIAAIHVFRLNLCHLERPKPDVAPN